MTDDEIVDKLKNHLCQVVALMNEGLRRKVSINFNIATPEGKTDLEITSLTSNKTFV